MKHFVPRTAAVSAAALRLCNRSRAFSKPTFYAALILYCAITLILLQSALAVTITTVPVGNVNNANDDTGFGSVDHAYRIGTTEVTNVQYAAFLNAKAASDPFALYNTSMSSSSGGITRSGAVGSYSYGTITGRGNKPVNFVSWYDAIRFANWLNNGQGNGNTETGAYTLTDSTFTRTSSATWFLPSGNEWYKAAYHKNDGPTGNYFDYPTSNDAEPALGPPPGGTNSANYGFDLGVGDLTNVGAYAGTMSPYEASDMGGNVVEWIDTVYVGSTVRGLRGGSFSGQARHLLSTYYGGYEGTGETGSIGFRVASISGPQFPGDVNFDGVVDFTDLGILLNNFNQPSKFATGDFNNSGTVDFTDLGILLNNYNQRAPLLSATAPVPEPNTLALAAIGLIGIGVAHRHKLRT